MILFVLALLSAAPSDLPATAAAPTVAPATAKPADDLDKMVCHSDPETGTRLSTHKECHTKREWAQMQTDNMNNLNRSTSTH